MRTPSLSLCSAAAAGALVIFAALIKPPPKPLRDRLARVSEEAATVDNEIYDAADFGWDQPEHPLLMVNAARCPYFISKIRKHLGAGPHRLLDVGCGGGFVTIPMAEEGLNVTGIDTSSKSIEHARAEAQRRDGLGLSYKVASAFQLPFPDQSFDVVLSSDVLEHLNDLRTTFSEIHRVLRPGGIFVFDTINRTLFSWVAIIRLAQDWFGYVPEAAHTWRLFITPDEARKGLNEAGLRMCESAQIVGMRPGLRNPVDALRRLMRGQFVDALLGPWVQSRLQFGSYLAFAVKPSIKP